MDEYKFFHSSLNGKEFSLLSRVPYSNHEHLSIVKEDFPEIKKVLQSESPPFLIISLPESGSCFGI